MSGRQYQHMTQQHKQWQLSCRFSSGRRLVAPSSYRSPKRMRATKQKLAVTHARPVSSSHTSCIEQGNRPVQKTPRPWHRLCPAFHASPKKKKQLHSVRCVASAVLSLTTAQEHGTILVASPSAPILHRPAHCPSSWRVSTCSTTPRNETGMQRQRRQWKY